MNAKARLGLRILMWIAEYVLRDSMNEQQAKNLEAIRTSLSVVHWEVRKDATDG